jgi:hypothetical protein
LISPSLEAVLLGPHPPLLIAAAVSSTSFGLLQPDAKSMDNRRGLGFLGESDEGVGVRGRGDNETLPVVAMRVSDPDCSALGIDG